MKLYPKKLKSIEDLKRERKLLLKETQRLDKEEFLSIKGVLAATKGNTDKDNGEPASIVDLLPVSNPMVSMLLKLVMKRFTAGKKQPAAASYSAVVADEPSRVKTVAKKAAVELIGGYLKWKAIELSYKGAKFLVKKYKVKKARQAAEKALEDADIFL